MPAEMQRTQLVAKWTLSSSHHRFQNVFSLYWESVRNAYDTCEKYTGAHEHNISYYYWTQRLKRNQTRKQNEPSIINGLHLSKKLSKSDLVFKTTKFSFQLGINEWTTNTSLTVPLTLGIVVILLNNAWRWKVQMLCIKNTSPNSVMQDRKSNSTRGKYHCFQLWLQTLPTWGSVTTCPS